MIRTEVNVVALLLIFCGACSAKNSMVADTEQPIECSREGLAAMTSDYLAALSAHDPTMIPVTEDVKFTENAQEIELGDGLWMTAGKVRAKRTAIDLTSCATHTQAVLAEGEQDVMFGVRLAAPTGEISEIETYISREGDYQFYSTEGLVDSFTTDVTDVKWEELVPKAKRNTREELITIANAYFDSFEADGYQAPMYRDCYRWEDGVQTTFNGDCSIGLPPDGNPGSLAAHNHRRYSVVDVEAGIAVGYVLFGGNVLDFHMFKIIDGNIRLIQATVCSSGYSSSGWDELEEAIPNATIDQDPGDVWANACANLLMLSSVNAGSYGTCEDSASGCSAGTMMDFVDASAGLLGVVGSSSTFGKECSSSQTCCLHAKSCEELSTTIVGLGQVVGFSLPSLSCQPDPCSDAPDRPAFGCPSGQYCCSG